MSQTMTLGIFGIAVLACVVLGYLYYTERQKTASIAISVDKGGLTVETK